MARIEFIQPRPRIEDWRVKVDGRAIGAVWKAGEVYIASVRTAVKVATLEAAFKEARKQAKSIPAT